MIKDRLLAELERVAEQTAHEQHWHTEIEQELTHNASLRQSQAELVSQLQHTTTHQAKLASGRPKSASSLRVETRKSASTRQLPSVRQPQHSATAASHRPSSKTRYDRQKMCLA